MVTSLVRMLAQGLWTLLLAALSCLPAWAQTQPAEPAKVPSLSLLVLGSGGPGATGRAGSCYLILLDGRPRVLVDAGPGAFVRLGEAGVDLEDLDIVLLTHLHVDHAGGLPGLVKARAVAARRSVTFRVFGPAGRNAGPGGAFFPGTSRFIHQLFGQTGAFGYLSDFAGEVTFRTRDLRPGKTPEVVLREQGLVISAIQGHHRDAPALIYRVEYGGRSLTFTGDLDPAGHDALTRLAAGTDLLVFHCVVLDPPGSPSALYALHTAPRDIGRLAARAHAGRLLLSHLSPAVERHRDAVLASVQAGFPGGAVLASDGLRMVP